MVGLILMAASAAASALSSASSNRASAQAFVNNANTIKDSYNRTIAGIQEQAKSYNDAIRLEMTNQRLNALQDTALTSNTLVEREIAGNTATRLFEQSQINQLMTHNVLAKKAEDASVSYGVEMENKRLEANNAIYAGQAVAQQNTISTTSAVSRAVSAGMAGYSMGSSLGSVFSGSSSALAGGASANSTQLATSIDLGAGTMGFNTLGGTGLQR